MRTNINPCVTCGRDYTVATMYLVSRDGMSTVTVCEFHQGEYFREGYMNEGVTPQRRTRRDVARELSEQLDALCVVAGEVARDLEDAHHDLMEATCPFSGYGFDVQAERAATFARLYARQVSISGLMDRLESEILDLTV